MTQTLRDGTLGVFGFGGGEPWGKEREESL